MPQIALPYEGKDKQKNESDTYIKKRKKKNSMIYIFK